MRAWHTSEGVGSDDATDDGWREFTGGLGAGMSGTLRHPVAGSAPDAPVRAAGPATSVDAVREYLRAIGRVPCSAPTKRYAWPSASNATTPKPGAS